MFLSCVIPEDIHHTYTYTYTPRAVHVKSNIEKNAIRPVVIYDDS